MAPKTKLKVTPGLPHLVEHLSGDVRLSVEEVQHVAGVLDAVLGRLLGRGEAVVAGTVEVLEAAAAVLQLIALARHDGLLLGHTATETTRDCHHPHH